MDNSISMFGEYKFYEDDKEIYRSKNLLTTFGKRYLTQYLAGQSNTYLKEDCATLPERIICHKASCADVYESGTYVRFAIFKVFV